MEPSTQEKIAQKALAIQGRVKRLNKICDGMNCYHHQHIIHEGEMIDKAASEIIEQCQCQICR